MKAISLIVASLALSACATGMNTDAKFKYGYIQVANLTGATISNVQVQVGAGGHQIACASVLNNELCQQHFNPIPYPDEPIQLKWVGGNGSQQSKQLSPDISVNLPPGIALAVVININGDGSVSADLRGEGF